MRVTVTVCLALLAFGAAPPGFGQTVPPADPPRGAEGEEATHLRGRLFISPMGEPFRGAVPQDLWFAQADANHDGALTVAEFEADATRWFKVLDREHDGEIDPEDIEYYETELAPEIRVGGGFGGGGARPAGGRGGGGRGGGGHRGGGGGGYGGGGGHRGGGGGFGGGSSGDTPSSGETHQTEGKQGAARFGYLDYPEPITPADTNFNRGVDPEEFRVAADARFAMLDKNGDGRIEKGELPHLSLGFGGGGGRPGGFHSRGDHPRGDEGGRQDPPEE